MLYVGIDVAKYKHDFAVIDSEGEVFIRHLKINNNREGFTRLQMTFENLRASTHQEIQVALEDTGHYAFNLLKFLRTNGYPTFSYNPYLIKEFAKTNSLRKTKTDKKDAMTIARKLREDIDKKLFEADTNMIELKYATRNVSRLKKDCVKQKTNYVRLLDILFPELAPALGTKSAVHNRYIYEILKCFPSATKLGKAHITKLTNLISTYSRGKYGKEKARELKRLAADSIGQDSPMLEFELLQTIDLIAHLTTLKETADKEVEKLMQTVDSPITTIPGIGTKLGAVILAEIRSIDNFKSPAQLLAFSGSEPSISTSGENQTESGKMVKRGSSQLRWALHESARLCSIWSPSMRDYYDKKRAEGKHYNIVLSHVTKKLVRIIFQLLKSGTPYQEDKMIINGFL
ncbi:IS110 family transposase [Tetragenococcus koreensis]|uniref:Transposase n=2 Tax=Tetragenococcus koreensis TaxID=290335 RepID=A0AAN4RLQ0_9ENTE|nr:IS110 family transposase [Tetragenococcus koreensis]GEQ49117.1 transposase [Tetragenococcus koreensis]GEQ51640.1 transposase [Tetragenococcus koreensis]GEQ54225.1 transposase [Tetragenococcus koreensis]GEQ56642.1 transposase [Tetragenococcus koreensis]GEQ59130.1 transposase [Tetragenococcus koreensis]